MKKWLLLNCFTGVTPVVVILIQISTLFSHGAILQLPEKIMVVVSWLVFIGCPVLALIGAATAWIVTKYKAASYFLFCYNFLVLVIFAIIYALGSGC